MGPPLPRDQLILSLLSPPSLPPDQSRQAPILNHTCVVHHQMDPHPTIRFRPDSILRSPLIHSPTRRIVIFGETGMEIVLHSQEPRRWDEGQDKGAADETRRRL